MGRRLRPVVVKAAAVEQNAHELAGRFEERVVGRALTPAVIGRCFALFAGNTSERIVALTYDDGPHEVNTPAILDVLAKRGATATFFVLAQQVEKHPALARRIIDEGHEIGLHGFDHRSLRTMGVVETARRLRAAKRQVESHVRTRVSFYRPPYGEYSIPQSLVMRGLGLDLAMWSGDALDWLHDDEANIARRVLDAAFPGGIILLHDHRADPETLMEGELAPAFDRARVLEIILDGLGEKSYRTVTVGALRDGCQNVRSLARYGRG